MRHWNVTHEKPMRLSILDQSPIRKGGTATEALRDTIELATRAEELGYERFWVSEHHSTEMLAGSSPEVLLAAVGAATRSIRIGSGGVMLPHYSPFKVAENFAVLNALYPGRIDLGVGRAPGSDMVAARALARDHQPRFGDFPQQAKELHGRVMLGQGRPAVTPTNESTPDVWMLGSSPDSALLAAELGLPYNVAIFINDQVPTNIIKMYRERFQPSATLSKPHAAITVRATIADSTEEAAAIARSATVAFVKFLTRSGDCTVPSVAEAASHVFSMQEEAFIATRTGNRVLGDPVTAAHQLMQLVDRFAADELMIVTITHDPVDRVRSFELLAKQLGIAA